MELHEFTEFADLLTERQAEAFFRRQEMGQGRQEAAAAMDTSPSNVDNLERAARQKIIKASNLMAMVESLDYEYSGEIGTCAECDQPTDSMSVHPDDYGAPLEEARMVCPDCSGALAENQ